MKTIKLILLSFLLSLTIESLFIQCGPLLPPPPPVQVGKRDIERQMQVEQSEIVNPVLDYKKLECENLIFEVDKNTNEKNDKLMYEK